MLPCSAFVNVTGKREGPGYLFIVKVLIFAQVIHNSQISRAHRDNSPNSPIPQVFTAFPQVPHVMFSFFLISSPRLSFAYSSKYNCIVFFKSL